MIKHHVREEEQREGMFAQARQSDMDLKALGAQLAARKAQLMNDTDTDADDDAEASRGRRPSTAQPDAIARFNKRVRGE
jgi:hypothetical protein